MPQFDLACQSCEKVITVTFSFDEFDDVQYVKCPDCGGDTKRIWHKSGAKVFLPAQMGFTKKGFID